MHVDVHPTSADYAQDAAARHGEWLRERLGDPPVIDVVHLGLGADGHTASLFPGDPAAEVDDRPVAISGPHDERWRMTLTLPVLNAARRRLWLVCGEDKSAALARLLAGDGDIPASRVLRRCSRLVADRAAAGDAITNENPDHPDDPGEPGRP